MRLDNMNFSKTFMLIAAMTALFMMIGFALGGKTGMLFALGFAAIGNMWAYWNSDKAILSMYHAQPLTKNDNPEIYAMVERLAQRGNMPVPAIYILDNPQPNAFATGRNPENAAVAFTNSLQDLLTPAELEGVIAHELAHIKNRDTLIMTITATLAGAISGLANMAMLSSLFGGGQSTEEGEESNSGNGLFLIILSVLAPMAAGIVQMMISRTREYDADRVGAELCGQPLALAGALQKIENFVRHGHHYNPQAESHPATAHLFIINPLLGKMDNLFSTHPNTSNRIAALQELARTMTSSQTTPKDISAKANPWGE